MPAPGEVDMEKLSPSEQDQLWSANHEADFGIHAYPPAEHLPLNY